MFPAEIVLNNSDTLLCCLLLVRDDLLPATLQECRHTLLVCQMTVM